MIAQQAPTAIVTSNNSNIRILRIKQLTAFIGMSRSSIYELMKPSSKYYDPAFPKPIHLSQSAVGWVMQEIEEWLQSKMLARSE